MDRLEECVRTLDPASRALLDLSLRRRLRDDDMAPVLHIDPFNLAWRRARAIERIATQLGLDDPAGIGLVRAALPRVADRAWGVPLAIEKGAAPKPPQAPAATALVPRAPAVAVPVRRLSDQQQRFHAALAAARAAAAANPEAVKAAKRGVLWAGAGALLGRLFSRRGRRRRR
ncbi:MAG: hypothetical protein QOD53_644 [Thermoleophilaceae bacterium]|jgi:hypothetical protein|nr:hypothetical protein [Thermoleophilaceae bacterium]